MLKLFDLNTGSLYTRAQINELRNISRQVNINSSSKRKLHTQPIILTSCELKAIFPRNMIKIDWHPSPFSKLKKPQVRKVGFKQGSILGIWGVKASPPKCPAFSQKILLSLQYISNYIGKIIQTRPGRCTHCNISQNCVSKCTRLHRSAYSFQKISGGTCPRTPLGSSSPSATWDSSPKR